MEEITLATNASLDANLNHSRDYHSTVEPLQEPFLYFDEYTELSFEDKSTIYCSLLNLVKADYPFDDALQDKAIRFLKILGPQRGRQDQANQLVTDLVPSSAGSHAGFVESILTLLSSPHSNVVAAALSFLYRITASSSTEIRCRLVESDLISKVLATFRPHTMSIARNEAIIDDLNIIVRDCLFLADPYYLRELSITAAFSQFTHREMIFQKVVLPLSQYVAFLISNRLFLNEDLLDSFMSLLTVLFQIGPFHRPTLDFVVASPIVMAFSSCLSFVEDESTLWFILRDIAQSLGECTEYGPEVVQSAKRMMQALFSEGFEDTLEQMLMNDKDEYSGFCLVRDCHDFTQLLGSNVEKL
ncbi:hypothetical protein BLNAU_20885 [Blattamonas nauphoetae]|uniref:Uncharacterized protein n=1 Tax=Blattamonas nauphoetae TaxID=2049346 RepID=A0ABQ9X0S0_9EUKA|nr:hypothetical protein BLNAU_20885 [Blattamonas nauphoetae]